MKQRLTLTLIACLLLNACSLIKEKQVQLKPVLPDNPLVAAENLATERRWGEAVTLLEQAIAQGWGKDNYLAALSETMQQQEIYEGELQAHLLLEETKALQKQLPILNRLAHSDPNNLQTAEKLLTVRSGLIFNRKALSECGWQQSYRQGTLAQQCLKLALSIEANAKDQRLLKQLTTKKDQTIQKEEKKQQEIKNTQWENRNQERLQQARLLLRNSQFVKSRTQLNLLLREDPNNKEAITLLSKLKITLEASLDSLLKVGDQMYREGQIEEAIATWQTAMDLDPNDLRAKEKMERADRVLKNLESLRKAN